MPNKYPDSYILKVVNFILDGLEPKDIAWRLEVGVDYVYKIRDQFFKQVWSLKRHPREKFDLD